MWREKNIYFTEHDIYFTKLMFILKNINLELKSALRTKYIFYRSLLYFVGLGLHLLEFFVCLTSFEVCAVQVRAIAVDLLKISQAWFDF